MPLVKKKVGTFCSFRISITNNLRKTEMILFGEN